MKLIYWFLVFIAIFFISCSSSIIREKIIEGEDNNTYKEYSTIPIKLLYNDSSGISLFITYKNKSDEDSVLVIAALTGYSLPNELELHFVFVNNSITEKIIHKPILYDIQRKSRLVQYANKMVSREYLFLTYYYRIAKDFFRNFNIFAYVKLILTDNEIINEETDFDNDLLAKYQMISNTFFQR